MRGPRKIKKKILHLFAPVLLITFYVVHTVGKVEQLFFARVYAYERMQFLGDIFRKVAFVEIHDIFPSVALYMSENGKSRYVKEFL